MKHLKRNSLIILGLTFVVLFFVLKDNFVSILEAFRKMDYRFILIAILCYLLYLFFKAWLSYYWVHEKEKYTLKDACFHTAIVQFFNGITPFSTGGQPMEIYMLKDHGIRLPRATNIVMQNFIVYQLALVLFGLFALGYNRVTHLLVNDSFLTNLIILGFIVNFLVALGILFIAISKRFTKWLVDSCIVIGTKTKLIKNKEKTSLLMEERLADFHQYTTELKEHKSLFVLGIGLNLLSLCCLYMIPLFLAYSLHDYTSLTITSTLVSSAYVLIMTSFVPIPGATGGIEYGFMVMFANFLPATELSVIMISWRFITYYLGMIIGGILFSIHQGGRKKCV